ncbi:unnamed protein product [Caenorhabditis auriculariae]|uniref:ZP domain-containing protein n=1 Tax=Caenorhabditis auriculariae TaxID=2777116 RepID=A0A8S1H317_9PELO|nr:unnamed protein product [Caenorhabditis auriculariae]
MFQYLSPNLAHPENLHNTRKVRNSCLPSIAHKDDNNKYISSQQRAGHEELKFEQRRRPDEQPFIKRRFGPRKTTTTLAMLRFGLIPTALLLVAQLAAADEPPVLDNGVAELPEVNCMEDRVQLKFKTLRPFHGRIFVKGMVDKQSCVRDFLSNQNSEILYELQNGACNMRRQRMVGPDKRGMEMSMTVIISFHSTFITKVDRAYRCTCFYMEADKVVTNRYDVSMLPTTDLIDTARMPLCTYSVRRDSITGPVVQFAKVGESVFHVWNCESDMFAMLVHSCFVDDGNGEERKPLLDEHGCAIDPLILPDLTYNKEKNLAYAQVNVFKFADKISTYFQCALSTCMNTEGMCDGKTPPRCGPAGGIFRRARSAPLLSNRTEANWVHLADTMDLAAQKITVLELDENNEDQGNASESLPKKLEQLSTRPHASTTTTAVMCMSQGRASLLLSLTLFLLTIVTGATVVLLRRVLQTQRQAKIVT